VPFLSFLQRFVRRHPEGGHVEAARPRPGNGELEALTVLSAELGRSETPHGVVAVLIEHVRARFDAEFAGVALIDEDGADAIGFLAHDARGEVAWWPDLRLDLHHPSGISSAARDASPIAVERAEGSPALDPKLVRDVGAKSAAFVPLVSRERVVAVLALATTSRLRAFSPDELALLQALAGEAALALDRTRAAVALGEALERERLVAAIARRVRSELDLDALLRITVEEAGRALGIARCFVRLGEPPGPMPVAAEWDAEDVPAIAAHADSLSVSNLAVREERTVALADVGSAEELDAHAPGSRDALLGLGTHSALATPLVVFDRVIGAFEMHRARSAPWTREEVALAESIAREAALGIRTAQLLRDNTRRLEQQVALLKAARVVTAELRLDAVLQRLVDEVAPLLVGDAADCYLFDPDKGTFRCAAVHGLPAELVGFELPEGGLAARALTAQKPAVSNDYDRVGPIDHPAYAGFLGAIVAPVNWSGETRGVLGVGTRDPTRLFEQADALLLEAFASLASLALRNAESFEEGSRQARIERSFYRIAAALGATLSSVETVDAVAQAACDALGADASVVLTPGEGGLEVAGSCALPASLAAALEAGSLGSAPALRGAAREHRTIAASELVGDERFGPAWQEAAAQTGYRSLLAIPISLPRTEESGLAVVFFSHTRTLTDDDLELGSHLAQAARGALERAELFETERNARALSQQLAQSGSLVASELDPAAVLDEAVRRAPAMLDVDASTFSVVEGHELVVAAASGTGAEESLGGRASASAGPAGQVIATNEPVGLGNVRPGDRARRDDRLLAAGFAAYLGVPLATPEGEGVLAVYSHRPRAWRQAEIDALAALASGAASALANAELYQRVTNEKERSEAILANIADGIVAVDREGQVVLWNAAAERISGVPAAEALGRRPLDVLHRRLEAEGTVPAGDRFVSINRGSEEVWLSLTEAVMHDPAGGVSGRIFAFRDISGERAVEQMKSDFVSTVSHELRTPLTSIYGFAETLLRSDVAFREEERRTFIGYIASEADRLTRIVDTLLNVARLDNGELAVQLAPTDVRSVVREVIAGAEESGGPNGHRFVVDLPDDVLDAAADRDKLRQVLNQLVDNAVKYSPQGGTVRVSGRRTDGAVELEVADEGVGIPHADQERIFRKFYRGEAAGREDLLGGTGLGLFIAQGLVTAMGGRIQVTSTEGAGSRFAFAIPAAERAAEPA
jgi:PAS domain S-box-containing protein